jgi:hypothetical protein
LWKHAPPVIISLDLQRSDMNIRTQIQNLVKDAGDLKKVTYFTALYLRKYLTNDLENDYYHKIYKIEDVEVTQVIYTL